MILQQPSPANVAPVNRLRTLKPNILVVDDDPVNQRMMQVALEPYCNSVESALNGLEAFEAIQAKQFDLVFMDLTMPVLDGIEASRKIREWEKQNGHSTYIVALTASYLPEKGAELFEAGIDNYIAKPFKLDELYRMLSYFGKTSAPAESPKLESQTPEPENAQVLDRQAALFHLGGNIAIYSILLKDFVGELPARLEVLRSAFQNKDVHALALAAHNLKGVSANLGAMKLSGAAKMLEAASKAGYTSALERLLEDVVVNGEDFMLEGQALLSGAQPQRG